MYHSHKLKKLLIGTVIGFSLYGCEQVPIVQCHQFSQFEADSIGDAISTLPPTSPILMEDKDYQRICLKLAE